MYYAFRILSIIALAGGTLVTLATSAHATLNDTNAPNIETARIEPQPAQEVPVAAEECYPDAIRNDAQITLAGEIGKSTQKEMKGERRSAASLTDAEREYWSTLDLIEK